MPRKKNLSCKNCKYYLRYYLYFSPIHTKSDWYFESCPFHISNYETWIVDWAKHCEHYKRKWWKIWVA